MAETTPETYATIEKNMPKYNSHVVAHWLNILLQYPCVVSTGVGLKSVSGKLAVDENGDTIKCIVVFVREKTSAVNPQIPKTLLPHGIPTDVREVGVVRTAN